MSIHNIIIYPIVIVERIYTKLKRSYWSAKIMRRAASCKSRPYIGSKCNFMGEYHLGHNCNFNGMAVMGGG